jgi:iron complex transport system ATP-binding protein
MQTSDGEIVAMEGLGVRRSDAVILEEVNWRVNAGENWLLMGANGSGKTSLLSVLAGYLTPSTGVLRVCGRQYGAFPWQELRAQLGIVSSSVKRMIQPGFTALEIVASGHGAIVNPWEEAPAEVTAKAAQLLDESGLAALHKRAWELLSQGERQRVLIARAMMADPKLLILDEPCSGLDPVSRRRFLDFVEGVAQKKDAPPLVLVTHHVEEITPSFGHVLLLKKGRVLASGKVEEVLTGAALSDAFGEKVALTRTPKGRWRLDEE